MVPSSPSHLKHIPSSTHIHFTVLQLTMGSMKESVEQELIKAIETLDLEEDIPDIYCDPDDPVKVGFPEVSAAAFKIKGGIERTPCLVSVRFLTMMDLYLV